MHRVAQRVLSHLRQQESLEVGDRVGAAVSGGIDSLALLRLLLEIRDELGVVVSVVHFNHKLRGTDSDADEQFVAGLARQYGLEFYCDRDDVGGFAREQGVSLETAARELRYGFFRHLIREGAPQGLKPTSLVAGIGAAEAAPLQGAPLQSVPLECVPTQGAPVQAAPFEGGPTQPAPVRGVPLQASRLDKILTGHTLDDQAETVLMRLIRGAGMRGLGGIHPRIPVEDEGGEVCGGILRPLLGIRRRELESYLKELGQPWREDATNSEVKFTRNRIRKLLVPVLEKEFNPSIGKNLAELSEIARGEEDYWDNEVAGWMGTGVHWSEPEWVSKARAAASLVQIGVNPQKQPDDDPSGKDLLSRIENAPWLVMDASVDLVWFAGEPPAVQRRIIKAVGDEAGIPLEFNQVEEIRNFAVDESGSRKELSLPLGWKVKRDSHDFMFVTPDLGGAGGPQDYEYDLPRQGPVYIPELCSNFEVRRVAADEGAYNLDQLLDADSLPGPLKVRNWRAGDRFWPAHTKSPKKIKELLQDRHVPHPERRLWPVVVGGDEIVWMRGLPVPSRLQAKPGHEALEILETAVRRERERLP
jgi:tRNA(Ile)-lysidine synthase